MDAHAPDSLLNSDPNTLPYFITEVQTERVVPVRFALLTEADRIELQGTAWAGAVFREAWLALVEDAQTLKLVGSEGADTSIQGIVRLGQVISGGGSLTKSLLETAPFNRHDAKPQGHRGVGRVLVARLVVESFRRGAQGEVTVRARSGSEGFYQSLGFRKSPFSPHAFALYAEEAVTLLQSALYHPLETLSLHFSLYEKGISADFGARPISKNAKVQR